VRRRAVVVDAILSLALNSSPDPDPIGD